MPRRALRSLAAVATLAGCTAGLAATAAADPGPPPTGLTARVIADGATLQHTRWARPASR
jgi:hypothetical protein